MRIYDWKMDQDYSFSPSPMDQIVSAQDGESRGVSIIYYLGWFKNQH